MREYLGLFNNSDLEKSKSVKALLTRFNNDLPKHFGKPRFIVAPVNTNLNHVLRADCSDKECRVRAYTHVNRNEAGILEIIEETKDEKLQIQYDRNDGCCSKCSNLR